MKPGRPLDLDKVRPADTAWVYYARVDGQGCVGTTEQVLEWAAIKWGFDRLGYPDLAKAMGVKETWWRQEYVGDGGVSFGILQVKSTVWPDSDLTRESTPYAADYAMAVVRFHYDGASWLGTQTKGDIKKAVGAWFCGCADRAGQDYITEVFGYNQSKPWKTPGQPPHKF